MKRLFEGVIDYPTREDIELSCYNQPEHISSKLFQRCNCEGFRKFETITFDSQDLYEGG